MKLYLAIAIIALNPLYTAETRIENGYVQPTQKIEVQKNNGYSYIKFSDQWVIFPGVGIGHRFYSENRFHRFNMDLTAYTYFHSGFSLYGKTHYLFYRPQDRLYFGIGAGVIGGWTSFNHFGAPLVPIIPGSNGFFIKPTGEIILGYEWEKKNLPKFIQLEMGISYGKVPIYPTLSFGTGI